MAIMRWDPFDAFLGAQEDLNRVFRRGWLRAPEAGATWAPSVDVYETEDSLVIDAEVPGIDPKDIEVLLEDGVLTLKGERKLEKEVQEENYQRIERAYGAFQRSIRLPSEVDEDSVSAGYDNGVLKITVPKVEPKKPKSVKIDVSTKKEKK